MPTSEQLKSLETRRQVMLERLKSGMVVDTVTPFLRDSAKRIREVLQVGDLTTYGRARQERLLGDIVEIMLSSTGELTRDLRASMLAIAVSEARFEEQALTTIGVDFEPVVPAASQIRAAVLAAPLSVRGPDGGRLLDPWLKNWSRFQVQQIEGAIRRGFAEGVTNQQMIQQVIGTVSRNYADGEFARIQRAASALVRTGVQHVAMEARAETLQANGVERYEWLSTLDDRTSDQCQALDGQQFEMGKGPLPPIHPNCRSSITAVLPPEFDFLREDATRASQDGPVPANQTYYEWLKTQPQGFQDQALGDSWGKVFREGGVSSDQFAKLRLGKDFKPITLVDLERINPVIFERAGL